MWDNKENNKNNKYFCKVSRIFTNLAADLRVEHQQENPSRQKHYPLKTEAKNTNWIFSEVYDHGKRLKDNDLKIGTWYVRRPYRVGATAQLGDALSKCRADNTTIQEMRRIGRRGNSITLPFLCSRLDRR